MNEKKQISCFLLKSSKDINKPPNLVYYMDVVTRKTQAIGLNIKVNRRIHN
jgi:hypothetical protein